RGPQQDERPAVSGSPPAGGRAGSGHRRHRPPLSAVVHGGVGPLEHACPRRLELQAERGAPHALMAGDPTRLGSDSAGDLTQAPAMAASGSGSGEGAATAPGLGGLTHLDAKGAVRQVDVTHKDATSREAEAEAIVQLPLRAWEALTK